MGDLAVEYVDIDSVTLDPANVRSHSPTNLEAIKGSLRRFGQQKPVVVSSTGVVAAGNGTVTAARDLGWKQIAAVRSSLSGVELAAYGIADNRSGELADWDLEALAETLGGLQEDGVDLAEIGFNEADLTRLLEGSGGELDPNAEWQGMPEYEQDDLQPAYRVTVSFRTNEDVDRFFALIERPRRNSLWWPEGDGVVSSDKSERYVAS